MASSKRRNLEKSAIVIIYATFLIAVNSDAAIVRELRSRRLNLIPEFIS